MVGVCSCFGKRLREGKGTASTSRFGFEPCPGSDGRSVREASSGVGSVVSMELSGSDERSLKLGRGTESKSGGRFTLDDEANAIASGPYGTPNLPKVSLEERNLTCSDVGPVRGYVNSVRVAV